MLALEQRNAADTMNPLPSKPLVPVTGFGERPGVYQPNNIPHYSTFFTHQSPLWQRLRGQTLGKYTVYDSDIRQSDWYPYEYPFGYFTDPSYYQMYPYWGAGYIYYRPYYAKPTGACVQEDRCLDGVSPLACTNFDNSKANAFYTGKTCRELKHLLPRTQPNYGEIWPKSVRPFNEASYSTPSCSARLTR